MGHFASVRGAKGFKRGNYFPCLSARYRVRILEIKGVHARNKGAAGIVEVEVIELLVVPHETRDDEGRTLPAIGDKRSWYCALYTDSGPGDWNTFVTVLTGTDIEACSQQEQEDWSDYVSSDEQPYAGVELELNVYGRAKTKSKGMFTVHEWSQPE